MFNYGENDNNYNSNSSVGFIDPPEQKEHNIHTVEELASYIKTVCKDMDKRLSRLESSTDKNTEEIKTKIAESKKDVERTIKNWN